MVKKLCILSLLLTLAVGCEGVVEESTSYDEVVDMAYETEIAKNNESSFGYTFTSPRNSQKREVSQFLSTITVANNDYSIYVHAFKYLEVNNLVAKTVNGDYILATDESSNSSDNMIYEYRRILIANNPSLTVTENQAHAQEVMSDLKASEDVGESFPEFAIQNSSDTATSSNGGYIGPVGSAEIDAKTLMVLGELEDGQLHENLIALEDGYDIIYLVKKYENEKIEETIDTVTDGDFEYTSYHGDFETYVIDNKNDTYSVVTKNEYITVSTNVSEFDIKQAIYQTIVTARSISINEDVVLNYAVNPASETSSAEYINLNIDTSSANQLSAQYKQTFSTSLNSAAEDVTTSGFKFDTRALTEEEYEKYFGTGEEEETQLEE